MSHTTMQQDEKDEGLSSSITTTSTTSNNNPQQYTVVYTHQLQSSLGSKRGSACKRPSTMDGILSIRSPPSCQVTLTSTTSTTIIEEQDAPDDEEEQDLCNDEEDSEEESSFSFFKGTQRLRRPPKRMKLKYPKRASTTASSYSKILYNGKLPDIAHHAWKEDGFQEDDLVSLPGGYQCQILGSLVDAENTTTNSCSNNTLATRMTDPSRSCLGTYTTTNILPRTKRNILVSKTTHTISTVATSSTGKENLKLTSTKPHPLSLSVKDSNNYNNSSCQKLTKPNFISSAAKPQFQLQRKRQSLLGGSSQTTTTTTTYPSNNTLRPIRNNNSTTSLPLTNMTPAKRMFPDAIGNLTVPNSITRIMQHHQEIGISFLWNCLTGASPALQKLSQQARQETTISNNTMFQGAILADEMGLGKTFMSIAVIFALHRRNKQHRFIIVCPSSLVANWSKEFDKWLGKASQPSRVVISKGGDDALRQIQSFVPTKPRMSEVLILSYEMFRAHSTVLSNSTQIGCLVVDEGHRLKNASGSLTLSALNSLKSESRLLLTGTPIQNNLSEFYSIVEFVNPGIFGSLQSFRREYENPISAAINKGSTAQQKYDSKTQSQALEAITSTFMLRRLQTDVLGAILPPKTDTLLFCRPSNEQCDQYNQIVQQFQQRSTSDMSEALTVLTSLRKLCSHPALLDDKDSLSNLQVSSSLSGKMFILESLLQSIRTNTPNDKCVIVSNFTSALNVIEKSVLNKRGWKYLRLDGTVEQRSRQDLVDSFNRGTADHSFVFLLSSKAGGCGLNLTGANRLFMFDPDWNPAIDLQAMARIYRQGQEKPCFVYRLFTTGSVEEIIYQRQTQKGNLSMLTSSKKRPSASFSSEDLQDCFELKDSDCDTKEKLKGIWEDYDGVNSLIISGITDEPLLQVANQNADILSYVRVCNGDCNIEIVEDEINLTALNSTKEVLAEFSDDSSFEIEPDEEAEFED